MFIKKVTDKISTIPMLQFQSGLYVIKKHLKG